MRTIILFLFIAANVTAQNLKEKELKTSIEEVTVFMDGAQIFEKGSVSIPAGKSVLRIKNISPFIDEKSIQLKAQGNFTVLSINHRYNYLQSVKKNERLDSLNAEVEKLEALNRDNEARLEVLQEKLALLNANKSLGGTSGTTLVQLKQAMDFYDTEITRIKAEQINIQKIMKARGETSRKIQHQLKEEQDRKILPTSEIEIRVNAENVAQATFSVTYLVANAGWYPKYDVRVSSITKPLQLSYKAEVFQNTGIDWKNVKLRFSNGRPNQSGVAPELPPWLLTYSRNTIYNNSNAASLTTLGAVKGQILDDTGQPLPGVNVLIKGTTIGTVTDANGRYGLTLPHPNATLVVSFVGYSSQEIPVSRGDMNVTLQPDVSALNEVVVTGYGVDKAIAGKMPGIRIRGLSSYKSEDLSSDQLKVNVIENQTTVEIEVDMPYSIKSDGEKLMVDLRSYEIPAEYEYYAVPKLDKDAFLVARIVDWDQYNLLEGETNLYFEDAFIGRSILHAKSLTDTLSISLGRDKSIVIGRTRVDQFSKKKAIGTNINETRGFKIVIRNKKSQPIRITLFDQVPVSIVSEISVTSTKLSGGSLDEKSGKVTWTFTIPSQEQKEFEFHYDVKYPRREKIILE
jgi:hypothetical protein